MFRLGEHVKSRTSDGSGLVVRDDGGAVVIRDDATGLPIEFTDRTDLVATDSASAPSDVVDPIHDYWLRHARNAGMAVQALRIINNNARQALGRESDNTDSHHTAALIEVEKFSTDILRHVFPT